MLCPAACWRSQTIWAADDEQVMDALYCAAAIGLNSPRAPGAAGAPEGAARLRSEVRPPWLPPRWSGCSGGTPEQALDASSIALSNLLGLVCDPGSVALGGALPKPQRHRCGSCL